VSASSYMRWERLDEPVKVRADFHAGVISPLAFRRGGAVVKVTGVNTRWQETRGPVRRYHFSVNTEGGGVFQLCFDLADLTWRLEYALTAGEI